MIARWENECISLSVPGSIPSHSGVVQVIFPWLITLYQPVLSQRGRKWLNLSSMRPHNLWTARRKAEVQPQTDDGWFKKKSIWFWFTYTETHLRSNIELSSYHYCHLVYHLNFYSAAGLVVKCISLSRTYANMVDLMNILMGTARARW